MNEPISRMRAAQIRLSASQGSGRPPMSTSPPLAAASAAAASPVASPAPACEAPVSSAAVPARMAATAAFSSDLPVSDTSVASCTLTCVREPFSSASSAQATSATCRPCESSIR